MKCTGLPLPLAIVAAIAGAQLCAGQARKQATFEVSSVKPNLSGLEQSIGINISGHRISGVNLPLRTLILQAYGLLDFQIVGEPHWLESDRFDIEATTGSPDEITFSTLGPLLQNLLADRFHLTFHRETRPMQTFVLEVDKGGPRLQSAAGVPRQAMSGVNQRGLTGTAKIIGSGVSMAALAYRLAVQQPFLGRTVVDKTGLTGAYDLTLEWEVGDDAAASILAALRTQLGLRLTSEKTPVEVLVIDSAEKLSPN